MIRRYDISEQQLKDLEQVLDLTVRQTGLKGAPVILDLVQTFQNPIEVFDEDTEEGYTGDNAAEEKSAEKEDTE